MIITSDAPPAPPPVPLRPRLGEELPVFCERCGYSLHGLPQSRCAECSILQFHCPECGHRQPINTLRPAVHHILGRVRALILVGIILFKLFAFFWLLMAWVAMGIEWSYTWQQLANPGGTGRVAVRQIHVPRPVDVEELLAFLFLGLGFGLVARMFLLRWKRGYMVGVWLAGLMTAAVLIGVMIQRADRRITAPWPTSTDHVALLAMTALAIVLGASIVWWIWSGLVRVFLPTRVATSVLDWQSFNSSKAGTLARE